MLFFLLSSAAISAPLSLEEVLRSVNERYPLLEGAKKDVEAAKGELRSSDGAFDLQWRTRAGSALLGYYQNQTVDSLLEKPTTVWGMTFFTGYRLGVGDFPIYDGKFETNPGGEVRGGLSIPLWRDGPIDRRRANLKRSQFGVDLAGLQVAQQRIEAVRGASQRFWDWAAAGLKVKIYQGLLKIAEERDKGLSQRVKAGDLPEFERRDNERAILQRKSQLVSAERALQQATIELSLFIRDPVGNPILVAEDRLGTKIPDPNEKEISNIEIEEALQNRPDLKRFISLKSQNEVERVLAENQTAPKIDVQFQAIRSLREGNPTRYPTKLEAGLLLEIPLQVNVAGGREESATATAMRLELQERFLRDKITAEVRDARSAIHAAALRVELTRNETELARKMEEGERVRFRQGDSNQLFVNIREQATADAAVREIDALADYQKSLATLQAALGKS
jgi:outer membrane protein TolC